MVARRLIPCLDVKHGKVVKGIFFNNHRIVGDCVSLARYYAEQGADELVFYDITASCEERVVDVRWIKHIGKELNIPFCVAGGIRTLKDAEHILRQGADKISINSPALEQPEFISQLVAEFGSQCVVIGVDSYLQDDDYYVYQYTGSVSRSRKTHYRTFEWLEEVVQRGAGEIVLNCMNQDGARNGYDLTQLKKVRNRLPIPLIASGGAGQMDHFLSVFREANVSGALAASVFHARDIAIPVLKQYLQSNQVEVRDV